jgi:hypothetical protein
VGGILVHCSLSVIGTGEVSNETATGPHWPSGIEAQFRDLDAMSLAQTQALLLLMTQDWDRFAVSAAQAWGGLGSGESAG